MGTSPTAPRSTSLADIEKKVGLLLDPAHLILLFFLIAAVLGGVYLFQSKRAEVAEAKAIMAEQVAQQAKTEAAASAAQNASFQAQTQIVITQLTQANAQLEQANKQLMASNAQLTQKLAQQQTIDAKLPPTELAQRWQSLVQNSTVTVTSSGYGINAGGGLATVQALEELPIDRSRIANLSQAVVNDELALANSQKALQAEQVAHTADNGNAQKQLVASQDQTKAVQAEYKAYQKKARKNYLKWFGIGFVSGLIGAHFAGI